MPYRKGDVITVNFPNSNLRTFKRRPALVIQDENINTGLNQWLIVMITSNLSRRQGKTRVFVPLNSNKGQQMGILTDSVIVADNIATVKQREIHSRIGSCPCMSDVESALRIILGL